MDKPIKSQILCKNIYYSCITKSKNINYHFCYNQFMNCKNPVKKQKILESKLNTKKTKLKITI